MRRWVKVALGVVAGLIVLAVLNAVVISDETRDAERSVEGSELVETSSGTIQLLDQGPMAGSPIVLIHGYAGSLHWYEELAPLLAAEHRVISVDLLGHGGSDKPKSGYEISDQANAIAEALGKLDVSGAAVVGHSLGFTVATALAEQSPEVATKLVDIDQATDDSFEDLSLTAKLGSVPVVGQALKRLTDVAPTSAVRSEFQQAFAPGFNIASGFEDPDQVVVDLHEMTYSSFVKVGRAEGDYSDSRHLDDRVGALGVPLLVIFGTEDQIYDTEAAIEPYEDVPGVQVELIEGSGHSPNVEVPEQIAPLIEAFAERPTLAEKQAAKAAKKLAAEKQAAKQEAVAKRKAATKKAKAAEGQ